MAELREVLKESFKAEGREFRQGYAESFLNSRIALQIRSNRHSRNWSQKRLEAESGIAQSQISGLEKVDNESWTIKTLQRLANAFGLVLLVKFASYGEALEDFSSASFEDLAKPCFEEDPVFSEESAVASWPAEQQDVIVSEITAGSACHTLPSNSFASIIGETHHGQEEGSGITYRVGFGRGTERASAVSAGAYLR